MKSTTPKVLHKIAGKQMLKHVLDTCKTAGIDDIVVIVGHQGDAVKAALTNTDLLFVVQNKQLGTGHAVLCAKDFIQPDDTVLVLCGDTPLITSETIAEILRVQKQRQAHAVVTAVKIPIPKGYGRVITTDGNFKAIVEDRDLSPSQKSIDLINTGVYAFNGASLLDALAKVGNQNSQNEYYLTDVPAILSEEGKTCAVYTAEDYQEFLGINSQKQLAEAAAVMRKRINERHMENGVVIMDPAATYIDCDVEIGAGTVIYPGTVIEAGSIIGENTSVGPFAHLRGAVKLGDNCRIGNFVELKNAQIASGSTAAHLAYIGDAIVGSGVNFGCGAITVNYDGTNKHKTIIEDDSFIGSNVNLIAPLTVHKDSFIAAGSTITDEVPEESLVIARARQVIKEGRAPKRVKRKKK